MYRLFLFSFIFLIGCSLPKEDDKIKSTQGDYKNLYLKEDSFSNLPQFNKENFDELLDLFLLSCKSRNVKNLYLNICNEALESNKAELFFKNNFTPYKIYNNRSSTKGLLTGYYEASINASRKKTNIYKYPIYKRPTDLIAVDLSTIYPELAKYRLRGKLVGNKIVPYNSREESLVNADVLCYSDSKIDNFFLEIQGSGRAYFNNGESVFIGYSDYNGHKYQSIGKYLVKIGAIKIENISLQTIKSWLLLHPNRVDEVLNYNNSVIYFKEKHQSATGALGLKLIPMRSVAVDSSFIPLGSMLYINSKIKKKKFTKTVFAHDTGSAIKGPIRADLFIGTGTHALSVAGRLKSELELWIFIPNNLNVSSKI